jgi:DNA polymerase III epsilon subunit-like protein
MSFKPLPENGIEIMVDLETVGTDPYSPVIAIGAVRFIAGPMIGAFEPFYQAITLESCMKVGLRPSADTIKWWMKQSDDAQKVFDDPEAVDLPLALDAFTDWYGSRPDSLWGNSAAFDLGLLAAAYKACGKEVPWAFYRERCYRTLKGLPGMERFSLKRRGTHHNALDDAISQAHHCRDMLMYLKPSNTVRNEVQEPDTSVSVT